MMIKYPLDRERIIQLQLLILNWFDKHQRSFPWRETRNPYQILIAEKLLQQTMVGERVVNSYLSILNKYPDLNSLARAHLDELSEIIAPLGLYYRAQEFIILATIVETQYHGELPRNYKKLLALPGIGEYTARAILSFAYNENIAIIDTNVARFLIRVFNIDIPLPANPARKKVLVNLATSILPDINVREFNFAVLDLCAAICRPKYPICEKCPVVDICYMGHIKTNENLGQ